MSSLSRSLREPAYVLPDLQRAALAEVTSRMLTTPGLMRVGCGRVTR